MAKAKGKRNHRKEKLESQIRDVSEEKKCIEDAIDLQRENLNQKEKEIKDLKIEAEEINLALCEKQQELSDAEFMKNEIDRYPL